MTEPAHNRDRRIPPPAVVKRLRQEVRKALLTQGFELRKGLIVPPETRDKDAVRALHSSAVAHRRRRATPGLRRYEDELISLLATNDEIDVETFSPELVEVARGSVDELLFRWASLHWSIPVSSGYGRRLRFLVRDRANGKLVGLIGLGDPVFALHARDDWVGWGPATRSRNLHHVADAFVLGAVPPYNNLLGGKLIAMLAASDEVRNAWRMKYQNKKSVIAAARHDGRLAMITTTSALGRSSIYNRLKLGPDVLLFKSVGQTRGSGEFHFSDGLHSVITEFALEYCVPTAKDARWGKGFRNRREVVKKALPALGFSDRLLYHGVQREMFVCPLALNTREFLTESEPVLRETHQSVHEITDWFRWRWMRSRRERQPLPEWNPQTWRLLDT
jgi:hypothetical protein